VGLFCPPGSGSETLPFGPSYALSAYSVSCLFVLLAFYLPLFSFYLQTVKADQICHALFLGISWVFSGIEPSYGSEQRNVLLTVSLRFPKLTYEDDDSAVESCCNRRYHTTPLLIRMKMLFFFWWKCSSKTMFNKLLKTLFYCYYRKIESSFVPAGKP
jgi:hypothetical protein